MCPKNGDVCQFLNDLCTCHAELDAMGVIINDDVNQSTIVQSLPWALANYTSSQLSAAKLHPSLGHTINPDTLIDMISEEWDRLQSLQKPRGRAKEETPADNTMAIETRGKWKGKE